jgi:hypothetical protein
MPYGILSALDTLAASNSVTIVQFGEDQAFAQIDAALAVHNALLLEGAGDLVEFSTDRLRRYGAVAAMTAAYVDEFGAVDTQKVAAGANIGFPLRKEQIAIGWTRNFMRTKTPADLAAQYTAAQDADRVFVFNAIQRAFLTATNTTGYLDRLVDNVNLPLRALLNADSTTIPLGPTGATFNGATHTHYLATASLIAANVSALIATVVEHGVDGQVRLYVNSAQEAAIRAMTGNFTPYMDARLIVADTVTRAAGGLSMTNVTNRAIGVFDAAEVWVKPWVLANYLIAIDVNPAKKPLVFRTRAGDTGLGNLGIAADHEHYPLRAQHMEREFGVSAWHREKAAVLFSGGGTYTSPTI